jgi:TolB-like protein
MALKTFKASTTKAALLQISREMGNEAVVVGRKKTLGPTGQVFIEVTAAPPPDADVSPGPLSMPVLNPAVMIRLLIMAAGLVALLLIPAGLGGILWPSERPGISEAAANRLYKPAESAVSGTPIKLAILPFSDLSAEGSLQYLCDGISEEIINKLSGLGNLRLSARTSSFAFREQKLTITEIGDRLGVSMVLEGSVRQSGNNLRVSAKLINVSDGLSVWNDTYDCELSDLLSVQEEIAVAIAAALKLELGLTDTEKILKRYTNNLQAYDLVMQGRHFQATHSPEGLEKSIELFDQAIRVDPDYALAYAYLALSHCMLSVHFEDSDAELFSQAERNVDRALQLNQNLAEAHVAKAILAHHRDFDTVQAEREYLTAVRLMPDLPLARIMYAYMLFTLGRFPEAERQLASALELDPLSLPANLILAKVLFYSGKHHDIAAQLVKLGGLFPRGYPDEVCFSYLAYIGEEERALTEFRKYLNNFADSEGFEDFSRSMDRLYSERGFDGLLRAFAESAGTNTKPLQKAEWFVFLKERGKALDTLEEYVKSKGEEWWSIRGNGKILLSELSYNPFFKQLALDPKFLKLTDKLDSEY